MTTAFSPGHVTCFFQPVRTGDTLTTGSRGVGFKLSLGTTVTVDERSDDRITIVMDGRESECPITRKVAEILAPGRGFDIVVDNDLPVGQGFGMSASGALASAVAVSDIVGGSVDDAYAAAHCAEVSCHGGLGDVEAIISNFHVPIRDVPGVKGITKDTHLGAELSLVVLGDGLSTKSVLTDPEVTGKIESKGRELIDSFSKHPSMESLFSCSREFSSYVGLETFEISSFLSQFPESGMCMLGHSAFTTATEDEIRELVGDIEIYRCETTDRVPGVIRRA